MTNEIHHKIEDHWKDKILSQKSETRTGEKYYVLSMFPYPFGSLHIGHVRVYAISDAVSRFHRLKGRDVIHPMGWDAFGLSTENVALERNIDPQEWTESNISNMKTQLKTLGLRVSDLPSGVLPLDPGVDPVDETVLADEQVDQNGNSWRSGAKVQKKLLKQWFIRTTTFTKSLMSGLDDPMLKEWRDIIKIQKHWIGECTGTSLDFKLNFDDPELETVFLDATVFNLFNNQEIPICLTKNFEFSQLRDNRLGIPGGYEVSLTLRDWLISRQRYWGTPIPIIYCKSCGTVPVPRDQLPVTLPKKLTSDKGIPNSQQAVDWLKISCPKCDADTMNTFVDSSWYLMRYIDGRETKSLEEVVNIPTTEKFIKDNAYLYNSRNYYVKAVTFNIIGSQQLSVAISKIQGLTNSIRKVSLNCLTHSVEYEKTLATQIIMLASIIPRFASKLWSGFCSAKYFLANDFFMRDKDVLQQNWPVVDSDFELDLDVVVNRAQVNVLKIKKSNLDKLSAEDAADLALKSPGASRHIKDRKILGFKPC
ncbi:hypothetical protein KQX54_013686 [Cotesia glomerata]|uniref:leucine--tRNA ligase n=1 Tax=Cotesia glomerata TaxID=32391 RepID=A0AAV7HTY5_COTGL|nr:hypothetical protein KQX54_013686 [Cotesia glomerata]